MYKIGIVTTTRAEYGLMKRMMRCIQNDPDMELIVVVSGTHLIQEYGYTVQEILEDGIPISYQIDMGKMDGSMDAITESMYRLQRGLDDIFQKEQLDLVIIEGDRYEMLSVASACLFHQIPIAHISGGEVTEGAIDDVVRNCLTKMSYYHFPACEVYRQRIIQMGEDPSRVFNYGDVGVDAILHMDFMPVSALEESLDIQLSDPYVMVTFHPVTMGEDGLTQMKNMLNAMRKESGLQYIITKGNADNGGEILNQYLTQYCQQQKNFYLFDSLGMKRYASLMKNCAFVLGNSSSGIYEAPSMRKPTVNIGSRQTGRIKADSIIDCGIDEESIAQAMKKVQETEFLRKVETMLIPFDGTDTVERILNRIKVELSNGNVQLKKGFYDLKDYGENK